MILLEKEPVPVPAVILLSKIVGLEVLLDQTKPLSVTLEPLSELIVPERLIVLPVLLAVPVIIGNPDSMKDGPLVKCIL